MILPNVADPVSGSGMEKKSGSGIENNPNPGPRIILTLDPGWKNFDPGPGINIPDQEEYR
jgi:hypothetical protein